MSLPVVGVSLILDNFASPRPAKASYCRLGGSVLLLAADIDPIRRHGPERGQVEGRSTSELSLPPPLGPSPVGLVPSRQTPASSTSLRNRLCMAALLAGRD